jgi:hypothetical protein
MGCGIPSSLLILSFSLSRFPLWFALGGEYGSGLPADTRDAGPSFLLAQYFPAISWL